MIETTMIYDRRSRGAERKARKLEQAKAHPRTRRPLREF